MSDSEYDKTNNGLGKNRNRLHQHPVALAAVVAGSVAATYVISRKKSAQSHSGNTQSNETQQRENHFVRTQTIDRPASELWAFWREEENAPRFMRHIQSVRKTGPNSSHWVMQAAAGPRVEWDSEIYEERPGKSLSWRTIRGDWKQQGRLLLRPAPGNRGTEVRLELSYEMPGGSIGGALASMIGRDPEQIGQANLARFKQLMEAGEIITVAGQPHGKRGTKAKLMQVLFREPPGAERASGIQNWATRAQKKAAAGSVAIKDRWQQAAKAGADAASSWKQVRAAR